MIGSRHCNNGMVAVNAPARLINISLTRTGGKAGGRTAPLHIHNHTGNFRHNRIAQTFLHQRKSGSAGRGHDFMTRERGADNRADRGDFIFHLKEFPSELRQAGCHLFGNLCGGRDGIACKKIKPRV